MYSNYNFTTFREILETERRGGGYGPKISVDLVSPGRTK